MLWSEKIWYLLGLKIKLYSLAVGFYLFIWWSIGKGTHPGFVVENPKWKMLVFLVKIKLILCVKKWERDREEKIERERERERKEENCGYYIIS